ncbi:LysR substrate-binding domain-containing protein [Brevibacterium sp. 50QC2O2]|jgi:DNA-binding transcriptional LysR family regulator|uniref:LysR substrate-binding domain-containing protein n=1 Tax=Brevibacterium TaxID=1696 RepID=UPI00211CDA99|nr:MULTISPECIES: LysR substrate-binding domain-containing protein [unclassified Brevibacterium]MCQ9368025.1 LysR substrate-binding domain-containing protein [Brevibacterium sp. 91QC2O2]MCQ9385227.1 LysR substrate-binding domain-containing protein [Brevibacterium sp. 68QC2CO]MCQ9388733.1 LysR substrate-binding domain-containing protein [Brevibacterium sp. 50QC2O2]
MEVQQARAFLTVAQELHFGRAAERLGMAQPLLSRTIRALEEDLGCSLFARTTRSVALTSTGYALLDPARRLLDDEREAREVVRRATSGQAGFVRFGFSNVSSKSLAARLVAQVRLRYPGIEFELHSTVFAEEGVAELISGGLDLALVRWAAQPPGVSGRPVLVEHPAVALPTGHRLAGRKSLRIAELADEDFVMLPAHPNSSLRETALRLCLKAGFSPHVVQEAPDSQTVTALVSAGLGVTITSDSVVTGSREPDMVTVPIDDESEANLLYLAHPRERVEPALATVLDVAAEVLPTLAR